MSNVLSTARSILEKIDDLPDVYLIGIAGLPGSGKTTLCTAIQQLRPAIATLSMDGYHIPRNQLNQEQLQRRGAPDTFDKLAFVDAVSGLKRTHEGVFPTFDHAEKDPVPHSQIIPNDAPLVIVEGLYLLVKDWRAESLFDFKIFVECSDSVAVDRLAARHLHAGLVSDINAGRKRAIENDLRNARYIRTDNCRSRADMVIDTSRI